MQSTGQTSTQERSFRLMHGSAMMYVIQAPASLTSRRRAHPGRIANIEAGPPQSSPADTFGWRRDQRRAGPAAVSAPPRPPPQNGGSGRGHNSNPHTNLSPMSPFFF